jgi:hypothetical protein
MRDDFVKSLIHHVLGFLPIHLKTVRPLFKQADFAIAALATTAECAPQAQRSICTTYFKPLGPNLKPTITNGFVIPGGCGRTGFDLRTAFLADSSK